MKTLYQYIKEAEEAEQKAEKNNTLEFEFQELEGREQVSPFAKELLEMMKISYKTDKVIGLNNTNTLKRNADHVTLIKTGETIQAAAIYRTDKGGSKITHIGCIQDTTGKLAMQEIIKRDIAHYKDWFWVEASGVIEHWFQKHNGYPIPNIYAHELLDLDVELDEDGYHYTRILGGEVEIKKVIFGFNSEEFYNKVMREYLEYEIDRMNFNRPQPVVESVVTKNLHLIRSVVGDLFDDYSDGKIGELTNQMKDWFLEWKKLLSNDSDRASKSSLRRLNYMLDEMPVIELHSFNDTIKAMN